MLTSSQGTSAAGGSKRRFSHIEINSSQGNTKKRKLIDGNAASKEPSPGSSSSSAKSKGTIVSVKNRRVLSQDLADESFFDDDMLESGDESSLTSIEDAEEAKAPSPPQKKVAAKKKAVAVKTERPIKPLPKTKARKAPAGPKRTLQERKDMAEQTRLSQPPIHDIDDIFDDIVRNHPNVVDIANAIGCKPIRVATMCSGTEAPLLALHLISRAAKIRYDIDLRYHHVFSAEIEPYKQGYIQRNFSPPLLFRDVVELQNEKAHTAYGSLVTVPGDVDVLIAGTSCVDFSNLNGKKKTIKGGGESARTWWGMMAWVKKHRPSIVIIENVSGAPWNKMVGYFEDVNYHAISVKVDTKHFYLPQTRSRGYLFATTAPDGDKLCEEWKELMIQSQRPWSSSLEAFALPDDDPRVHKHRKEVGTSRVASEVDWGKCEDRHVRARMDENLGDRRPLTGWQKNGGKPRPMSHMWPDYIAVQVERVCDLTDINALRLAQKGIDVNYKSFVWNLSQNVDRTTGSGAAGLSPCLTPTMIPYITNRGGPALGIETLALQGIPIDELIWTRETDDQLKNLSGNAMSSSVVACCMLNALFLCREEVANHTMDVDGEGENLLNPPPIPLTVVGEEKLKPHMPSPPPKSAAFNIAKEKLASQATARLCICEGRTDVANNLSICQDCHKTCCSKCQSQPEHNYTPFTGKREDPKSFIDNFSALLPVRMSLSGIDEKALDKLASQVEETHKQLVVDSHFENWRDAVVTSLADAEFRYVNVLRQNEWIANYDAQQAQMQLLLNGNQASWHLYAKPSKTLAASDSLRERLGYPIARMSIATTAKSFIEGSWQVQIPLHHNIDVQLSAFGKVKESWKAALGLQGEDKEGRRWSHLKVEVKQEDVSKLDEDISGTYTLLPSCESAEMSLHVRTKGEFRRDRPMFLFLDPSRDKPSSSDFYVFSRDSQRLAYGQTRNIVASFDSSWRPPTFMAKTVPQAPQVFTVPCNISGKWVDTVMLIDDHRDKLPSFSKIPTKPRIELNYDSCQSATALMIAQAPIVPGTNASLTSWSHQQLWGPEWTTVSLSYKQKQTFERLNWLLKTMPVVDKNDDVFINFGREHAIAKVESHNTSCNRCAPPRPSILFSKIQNRFVPFEDAQQAAQYERALKTRPQAFKIETRLTTNEQGFDMAQMRISFNPSALAHSALHRFPVYGVIAEAPILSWRLVSGYSPDESTSTFPKPKFTIGSNKLDEPAEQPVGFKVKLRPEQLRSVGWMLRMEQPEENVTSNFEEEEVVEGVNKPLGLRCEAKASRKKLIRGGVSADQVGYGKTALSIAAIFETRNHEIPPPADLYRDTHIPLKATLVVVPAQLTEQWPHEIAKFVGNKLNVITIANVGNLKKYKLEQFKKADVIVIAHSLFTGAYFNIMCTWAAQDQALQLPASADRYFKTKFASTLDDLGRSVKVFKEDSLAEFRELIEQAPNGRLTEAVAQSKRYKGAALEKHVKMQSAKGKGKATASSSTSMDIDGADSDSSLSELDDSDEEELEDADSDDDMPRLPGSKKGKEKAVDKKPKAAEKTKFKKTEKKAEKKPKKVAKPKKLPLAASRNALLKLIDSPAVKKNRDELKNITLHAFHFKRIIIDEYTYLDGINLETILSLRSTFKWILSGTPPIKDFAAVNSIARFLDVHLGIDDPAEVLELESLKRKQAASHTLTPAEVFLSYTEIPSRSWYERRLAVAQRFLQIFVRANDPEIDKIICHEIMHPVTLPAAERALYLELLHYISNNEAKLMSKRKSKDIETNDRNRRLMTSLAGCDSPTEALIKQSSHFDLGMSDQHSAITTCDAIVKAREEAVEVCLRDISRQYGRVCIGYAKVDQEYGWNAEDLAYQHVHRWREEIHNPKQQGDRELAKELLALHIFHGDTADKIGKGVVIPAEPRPPEEIKEEQEKAEKKKKAAEKKKNGKKTAKDKPAATSKSKVKVQTETEEESETSEPEPESEEEDEDEGEEDPDPIEDQEPDGEKIKKLKTPEELEKEAKHQVRELISLIRRLVRELQVRISSLRFIRKIRDLQKGIPLEPCLCGQTENLVLLSTCGHHGCSSCAKYSAAREECLRKSKDGCRVSATNHCLISTDSLGLDQHDERRPYGAKIQALISLIKDSIPAKDRILVFVQYPSLMQKVEEALKANGITTATIAGSATKKSKALSAFQGVEAANNTQNRVLLLNSEDASASGANLTVANHAIFLSPLHMGTQEEYDAREKQAIGRVRRFGQTKEVTIHRFVTLDTIDTKIFAERTGRTVELKGEAMEVE